MIVNDMLRNFKEELRKVIHDLHDNAEYEINQNDKEQLFALYDLLLTNEYNVRAMTDNFNIKEAPNMVYLFNTKKNMFWKGLYGYTRDLYSAGLFPLEEALTIVEKDYDKATKIVYF